ncbi:hypothetical protein L1887_20655 [Cichorium endivia]|nr:hypothetical protein L1887_20655 [Cichorium endivia]
MVEVAVSKSSSSFGEKFLHEVRYTKEACKFRISTTHTGGSRNIVDKYRHERVKGCVHPHSPPSVIPVLLFERKRVTPLTHCHLWAYSSSFTQADIFHLFYELNTHTHVSPRYLAIP